jgi:hypothetical protein
MTAEGLWTIQFAEAEEDFGGMQLNEEINRGGTLVLQNERVYGGGISYYFVGTYDLSDSGISLIINCTKYNDIVSGVFGPVDEVRILLNGIIDGETMTLHGHIEDEQNKKLKIKAERKSKLQ